MANCNITLDGEQIFPVFDESTYADAQFLCGLRFNGRLATIKTKEGYEGVKSSLENCNAGNEDKWVVGVMLEGGEENKWADGSEFDLESNKHLFLPKANFSLLSNSCRVPYMTAHRLWDGFYLSTKENCRSKLKYFCTTHSDITDFGITDVTMQDEHLNPTDVIVPLMTVLLIAVFAVFVYRREQRKKQKNRREVEMTENVIYGVTGNGGEGEMKENVLYGVT